MFKNVYVCVCVRADLQWDKRKRLVAKKDYYLHTIFKQRGTMVWWLQQHDQKHYFITYYIVYIIYTYMYLQLFTRIIPINKCLL